MPTRPPSPAPTLSLHVYPDLEAKLPTTVGGQRLNTASLQPDPSLTSDKTLAWLARLGKSIADLQIATADRTGLEILIKALRIKGADAHKALDELKAVDEADPKHLAVYGTAHVGGKDVITRTVEGTVYNDYPVGDIVYEISGSQSLVEDALTQLP